MCRIGKDDLVLIVKGKWLKLIYKKGKGCKRVEIRPHRCKRVGARIYFCESGKKAITGSAKVSMESDPLSAEGWDELRSLHCVAGPPIYEKSFAWFLEDVERYRVPIPVQRKRGSQGLQYGAHA